MGFWYRILGDHDVMMPGLIFRPGVLDRLGIAHLQDVDIAKEWQAVPDSDTSFVIGPKWGAPEHWHRVSDEVELGWQGAPDPGSLQKPDPTPGFPIQDASERAWLIPNGNPESKRCSLPQDYRWTMEGPQMVVDASFAPIVEFCQRTFNEILEADTLSQEWTAGRALEILQLNYRIGHPELTVFDHIGAPVLNKQMAAAIVTFFVDFELLERASNQRDEFGAESASPSSPTT